MALHTPTPGGQRLAGSRPVLTLHGLVTLLAQACEFQAAAQAGELRLLPAVAPGAPVALPPADFPVVEAMVEDWAAVMVAMPARDIIRAFRATDRRIRDIEAGRLQPHDYTVTTGAARALGARL